MSENVSQELFRTSIRNALKERILQVENKTFELLYKASRDGCSVIDFQIRCLNKGPTLTVLYGQDGTVFGGYTSKSWTYESSRVVTYDNEAFLFYCNPGKTTKFLEMKQSNYDRAITCHCDLGPTFGGGRFFGGCDLQVFGNKKKISKENGCFELNGKTNYNCIYKAQEAGFDAMSINGGTLIVKDLEVYGLEVSDFFNVTKLSCEKRIETLCLDSYVKCFNILMTGLVSAGKTSFCRTVSIASTNKIQNYVGPIAQQGESVTNKLTEVIVKQNNACTIRLLDVRGFEDNWTYGEELERLLKGKIKDWYKFLDSPGKSNELVDDCNMTSDRIIHTLCVVIDATKFEVQSPRTLQHMKDIFIETNDRGIQVCVIVTHLDKLCEYVQNSPDNIKRSVRAHNIMANINDTLGIGLDNIFPVINYTDEEFTDEVKDMLALRALAKMVENAGAFVGKYIGRIRVECLRAKLKIVEEKGLNILCVGRVNVGKSFFIDSLMSTFKKRPIHTASGGRIRNKEMSMVSQTQQLRRYTLGITDDQNQYHKTNVHFYDMPGLSSKNKIDLEQINKIVEGHCAEGFDFETPINEDMSGYIKNPEWLNRIHFVCFILDNNSLDKPEEEKDMIQEVIDKVLTSKGIPHIVVVTKLDQLRERELSRDAVIKKTADSFGLIPGKIHAVKNYVDESRTSDAVDIPLIGCFEAIMEEGCFYYQNNHENKS